MRLDPELNVTHLKHWSLTSVVSTDIFSRAIPWSRLILETSQLPSDLNLRWSQRVAAALAPFVLLGLLALPWALATGRLAVAALAFAPIAGSLLLHRDQLSFFSRIRGAGFAVRFWLFHQVHLSYSAATAALCAIGFGLGRRRQGR
jgi:hypothetical protein